jgi:hypothetical protein
MLIKESTLRRIIKEEARRVLREDAASFTPDQIEARLKAIAATRGVGPNPLSDYQRNWGSAASPISRMGTVLESIAGYKGIPAAWTQIYRLGALDPRAAAALQTMQNLPSSTAPVAKLRAILRSISTSKAFTGVPKGGLRLPDYDDDLGAVSRLDAAIKQAAPDMENLINSIKYVISFDLSGAMLPAPTAAPAPAAAPMDWTSYVAKTKGGADVKVAWEAYAASKGAKPDFGSFARWWQAYRKSNSNTFDGTVGETIGALKLTAAPAAASAPPVKPGTAAAPR